MMETTMLAIFVPLGYVAGWLVAGRVIFSLMDDDEPEFDGPMAMLAALIWPVLMFLVPAWMFVTWPSLKKDRAARRARLEREREWEGCKKTAELEREVYGTTLSTPPGMWRS